MTSAANEAKMANRMFEADRIAEIFGIFTVGVRFETPEGNAFAMSLAIGLECKALSRYVMSAERKRLID